MDGVLCFMLFAGSCHMKLLSFKKHAKIISLLAIGATFLGAVFYGLLFYGASVLLHLGVPLPVCLMFGSITAPTDPIAATSILKKFNLPEQIGFIIEGESLLNDGVGVALFVCFSGMEQSSASCAFRSSEGRRTEQGGSMPVFWQLPCLICSAGILNFPGRSLQLSVA